MFYNSFVNKRRLSRNLGWVILVFSSALQAQVSPEGIERLRLALPGITMDMIRPSPLVGMYKLSYGSNVYYISEDGRYLFTGDLIELDTGLNLTEQGRKTARIAAVAKIDATDKIVFPASNPKHTITVFTDVDCGYCRKLHAEVSQLNDNGITVEYLAFPRGGPGTVGFDKMVWVWCADDPKRAMTQAKLGKSLTPKNCASPVAEQYQLGLTMPVKGTPTILLSNGELIGGYVPAAKLIERLNQDDG
ncbi:MAG TPA: DsbC family protein [Gammaproteobacteria bacterium]|nr:DsbC family protein [Gammaproteobacteria bacterium]